MKTVLWRGWFCEITPIGVASFTGPAYVAKWSFLLANAFQNTLIRLLSIFTMLFLSQLTKGQNNSPSVQVDGPRQLTL